MTPQVARVLVNRVRLERTRQFGACFLGWELWMVSPFLGMEIIELCSRWMTARTSGYMARCRRRNCSS